MNIIWKGSPNFDKNRKPINTIVIHWIVGTLASADAQFQKTTPGTSAHYGIENKEIHQYVKEEEVAYHAGVYAMNQRSIGIEHSAAPDRPATDETYNTSGELIAEIAKRHDIPLDRTHIIGHKEVKATQCPGTMDIDRLIRIAQDFTKPQVSVDGETFQRLVSNSTKYDEFNAAGYPTVQDVVKKIDELNREKNGLTESIKSCENRNITLADELRKKMEEDSSAIDQGFDAQKERDQMLKDYEKLQELLKKNEENCLVELGKRDIKIIELNRKLKAKKDDQAELYTFKEAVKLVIKTLAKWGKKNE